MSVNGIDGVIKWGIFSSRHSLEPFYTGGDARFPHNQFVRDGRGRPSLHELFLPTTADQSAFAVCGVESTAFPDNVSQPLRDKSQKIK